MRFIIPISIIYILCAVQGCKNKNKVTDSSEKKYKVTIVATFTSPYCGGARPTDEILEYYRKPRPLPAQVFHVKPGETNSMRIESLAQAETDTAGKAYFELPAGKYMLLLPVQTVNMDTTKYADNQYYKYDRKCMIERWKKPLLTFEVKADGENKFSIHLSKACFVNGWWPCEYYTGPKPP